mmetsp:Transcript_2568/g.4601  ORF Transcript_2568/g.4601 Transcript_2568/m.4601 type:complete len:211 (-) Transcript_2568:1761-2393(-)
MTRATSAAPNFGRPDFYLVAVATVVLLNAVDAEQVWPTRYVILSSARTGSTLLATSLSQHPEIFSHHELLQPVNSNMDPKARHLFPPPPISTDERRALQNSRRANLATFLSSIWNATLPGTKAVGFKLQRGHLPHAAVKYHLLNDTTIKKIVLFRSDLLGMLASIAAAQSSGNWGGTTTEHKVTYNPTSAVNQVGWATPRGASARYLLSR